MYAKQNENGQWEVRTTFNELVATYATHEEAQARVRAHYPTFKWSAKE